MQELFPVLHLNEVEVVDSRVIAAELEIQHKNLIETIEKYKTTIEKEFGLLAFQTEVKEQQTGFGKRQIEVEFCYLTEDQALFIGSLSRNSEAVVRFKVKLVKSFQAARKALTQVVQITREQKIAEALMLTQEIIAEKDAQIKMLAPKAEFTDVVLKSSTCRTVTEIAKELGMTAIELNKALCERGIQFKHRGRYVLHSKYDKKGYTDTETHPYFGANGEIQTSIQMVWTEYGRVFIHWLFNQELSFSKSQNVA